MDRMRWRTRCFAGVYRESEPMQAQDHSRVLSEPLPCAWRSKNCSHSLQWPVAVVGGRRHAQATGWEGMAASP